MIFTIPLTPSKSLALEVQNVTILKYALIPDLGQESLQESRVSIQGGANGYVNPGRGEKMRFGFNSATDGDVTVKVYDLGGRLVWESSKWTGAGLGSLDWDGTDQNGEAVPSDVYVVKVKGPGIDEMKKAVILR